MPSEPVNIFEYEDLARERIEKATTTSSPEGPPTR
jgi:hypothetical protein